MKKTITIFFILLANILMLVHVVIPHHHHSNEICLEDSIVVADSHEHHNEIDHLHDAECHIKHIADHQHNSDNDHQERTNFCPLIQIEVILSKSSTFKASQIASFSIRANFDLIDFSLNTNSQEVDYSASNTTHFLNLSSPHSRIAIESIGTRGPPSIV